jgi:hypothetical protein
MQTIGEYLKEKQHEKLIDRIIDLKLTKPQTPLIKKEIQKLQQQL